MTRRFYKTLCLFFIVPLFLLSCTAMKPALENAPDTVEDGSAPIIRNVQSGRIIDGKYIATSSFLVGDKVNFVITASDPENDITKAHLKEYYATDINQVHSSYKPIEVLPRSDGKKSFWLKEPIEFLGPPGEHKFDIQLEDGQENLSNIYSLYIIIH